MPVDHDVAHPRLLRSQGPSALPQFGPSGPGGLHHLPRVFQPRRRTVKTYLPKLRRRSLGMVLGGSGPRSSCNREVGTRPRDKHELWRRERHHRRGSYTAATCHLSLRRNGRASNLPSAVSSSRLGFARRNERASRRAAASLSLARGLRIIHCPGVASSSRRALSVVDSLGDGGRRGGPSSRSRIGLFARAGTGPRLLVLRCFAAIVLTCSDTCPRSPPLPACCSPAASTPTQPALHTRMN